MKRWWMIGFLFVVLFIVGCQGLVLGGERPEETSSLSNYVRSGVNGLEMFFIDGLPPRSMYDTTDLVIVLDLKNQGTHDLAQDKCFVEMSGPDWNIIRGINKRRTCGDIDGKSVFNTEGGFNQIEFKSQNIYLPQGVDQYSPNIVLNSCYNYKTVASPQVCIDPGFYQITAEQKACQVRDVSLGGGQGAPVSIDLVKVDMLGEKALFEIDVSNSGGGRVISPLSSLNRCPGNLNYNDFDEVRYTVSLSGEFPEKCTPTDHMVRLSNNKGKIFCTFRTSSTTAYESPLQIELNYNYLQSVSKKIDVIRTPR